MQAQLHTILLNSMPPAVYEEVRKGVEEIAEVNVQTDGASGGITMTASLYVPENNRGTASGWREVKGSWTPVGDFRYEVEDEGLCTVVHESTITAAQS